MINTDNAPVYRITDIAQTDRPRERLRRLGAKVLSTPELLAILLRVGVKGENAIQVGQRLLGKYKNITGLHRAPFDELCNQHGIGEAKAAQIKAALELGARMARETPEERTTINSPADAAAMISFEMTGLEEETPACVSTGYAEPYNRNCGGLQGISQLFPSSCGRVIQTCGSTECFRNYRGS